MRRAYGAHPLQLVLILASFALVGYTVQQLGLANLWNPDTWWQSIAVWFVGAALAHDLLLFPVYAAADRILTTVTDRKPRTSRRTAAVPVINFIRVPLLACGLISVMFFPGIIRQGTGAYHRATGQTQEPFLRRWLILCALILLTALVSYLVVRVSTRRRRRPVVDESAPATATGSRETPRDDRPAPAWAVVVVVVVLLGLAASRGHRRKHLATTSPS